MDRPGKSEIGGCMRLKQKCTVYMILNTVNQRAYFGHTTNLKNRWVHHKSMLRAGRHHNPGLQADWLAQKESDFDFSIVKERSESMLYEERQLVEQSKGSCYNVPPLTQPELKARWYRTNGRA